MPLQTEAVRAARSPRRWAFLTLLLAALCGGILGASRRCSAADDPKRVEPNRGGEISLEAVDPQVALSRLRTAPGYEVNLFASEKDFPLDNPVSLTFDSQGRMWVATMPTYPQYLPGTPPNDKLIILEDTDRDGRADKHTVFIDGLHLPTGFELGHGGVYVAQQPNLLFARDTDGDDVADEREVILHGFGTEDSHHAISAFTWGPGGGLYFQEGTFHHSQVETPYGPVRLQYAGVFRYKPRRFRLEVFVSYPFANPWGHVFDRWGQNFIADASGGANYFGSALSGHVDYPNKHDSMKVFTSRVRPTAGCEIVSSRHFPEEAQGNFLVNNCIGFQGIKQHRMIEDGSGFTSEEVEPLLESLDINFRPVDIQFGPDGALYIVDWFNPLIGHMQYSLRDERRDHRHGRIWRITYKGRPLLDPPDIAGASIPELLELLKSYEDRTRYRVRRELTQRDPAEVLAAVKQWVAKLDPSDEQHEHHLLEALWVHQTLNAADPQLLARLLASPQPRARAAATRVLRYWREEVPDPLGQLASLVHDAHPRVRLEAVLALSFFRTPRAAELALEILKHPRDYYLDYVLKETIRTLEPYWRPAVLAGEPFATENPDGIAYLLDRLPTEALVKLPVRERVDRALLIRPDTPAAARSAALKRLAERAGRTTASELVRVISALDAQRDDSAAAAIDALIERLIAEDAKAIAAERASLDKLARDGRRPPVRQAAWAALIVADGGPDRLWPVAREGAGTLRDFVAAARRVPQPELRARLYPLVSPLLDGLPEPLASRVGSRPGRLGRYVRIELPGDRRTLTLAEVQVFSGGQNVARDGRARQSSTAFEGSAQRAIDGNTNGAYAAGGQTHTRENVRNPWWEVDLGDEHAIESVVVWNRDEAGGRFAKRLDGFTLIVLDSNRQEVFRRDDVPAPAKKIEIPVEGDPLDVVRAEAIRTVGRLGVEQPQVFEKLARFIVEGIQRPAAIEALIGLETRYWNRERLPELGRAIVEHFGSIEPTKRTSPDALAALDLGHRVAAALGSAEGQAIADALDDLAVQVIRLRAVPHQMRYDRSELAVEAGKPVEIIFENTDVMPHNVIVARPGSLAKVGQAAERMTASGDAYQRQFIPPLDAVLEATNLVQTGETAKLQFIAPQEPGDYPYLCTFPGHYRTMNGVMHVVADVKAYLAANPLPEPAAEFEARPFVRDWTFGDLIDALDELHEGRSYERGVAMFKAASCVACHRLADEGHAVGPDLLQIRRDLEAGKRTPSDVLREILEPSRQIHEKFRSQIIVTADGEQFTGLIVEETPETIKLLVNPLADRNPRVIAKQDIDEQVEAKISLMPKGLLNTLSREEILDLLALVISGGDPQHPIYRHQAAAAGGSQ